jgi:hypothetical protein
MVVSWEVRELYGIEKKQDFGIWDLTVVMFERSC